MLALLLLPYCSCLASYSPRYSRISRFPKEKSDPLCDLCIGLVKTIDAALEANSSIDLIEEIVKQMCGTLPQPFSGMCDSLIVPLIPQIIDFIESGLQPDEVCSELGICSSKVRPKLSINRKKKIVDDSVSCLFCQFFVSTLENYLVEIHTEEEIYDFVLGLCEKSPQVVQVICNDVILPNLQLLIELIDIGIDYLNICQKIGLCPTATLRSRRAGNSFPRPRVTKPIIPKDSVKCELCNIALAAIQAAISTGKSIDEIKYILTKVCDAAPKDIQDICIQIFVDNVQVIIQLIDIGLDFIDICGYFGLCDDGKEKTITTPLSSMKRFSLHSNFPRRSRSLRF